MSNDLGRQVLDVIKAGGRRVLPMHEFLAKEDPKVLDAYNEFLTSTIYENDALPESMKEMLLACVCVAVGSSQAVIANHCRRALTAGIDRKALLQGLEITAAVMATKTMATGVTALMEAETK